MVKFKIGDTVECIDAGGYNDFNTRKGNLYTISVICDGLVGLKEADDKLGTHPISRWYSHRFKLVKDKEVSTPPVDKKAGDKVSSKDTGWGFE